MLNLFKSVTGLFCTPKSVTAQPDWLASITSVNSSQTALPADCIPAEFVSKTARKLSEDDYAKVSKLLACDVAAIKAVREVEASGNGFLSDKRPTILFEAHVFGRLTKQKWTASNPKISAKSWDRSLYGAGGNNQYVRMSQAAKLDRASALSSASWGLFQIMGFNHKTCGFPDVESFVQAMCQDELQHLQAFAAFVMANPVMHKALRNRDWKTFAKTYNGPAYAANKYDTKLAAAHARFK